MAIKGQHVVPRDGKWAVRKHGSARVTRRYDTQREAFEAARELARKQGTEVYVHGRDGRVREWHSYGALVPNRTTVEAIEAARRGDLVEIGTPSEAIAELNQGTD